MAFASGLRRLPLLNGSVRRVVLVVVLAGLAQAGNLPEVMPLFVPTYGTFGFRMSDAAKVIGADASATKAGIHQGDRIDLRAMPADKRLNLPWGWLALAPIGRRVTFPVVHDGVRYSVTRTAVFTPDDPLPTRGTELWANVAWSAASFVLTLVGAALVLVRPGRLTWAFFLYAVGSPFASLLWYYSFLPVGPYTSACAVSNALGALGTLGFLLVALRLPSDPPTGWRRAWDRAAPLIYISLLIGAVAQVTELVILGIPAVDGSYFNFGISMAVYAVALASLISSFFDRRVALEIPVRVVIAGLAMVGILEMLAYLTAYVARLPSDLVFDTLEVLNLIVSLAVAYVIARYRVVAIGLVVGRTIAYGTVAASIIATFAAVNLAFAKEPAYTAFVIPLEIVVALLLGYWLTGLSDVAAATALSGTDAPAAALRGARSEEREILLKALGRAERTRRSNLVAEVRARTAFSAWMAGEDDEMSRQVTLLQATIGDRAARGLGFFARAASGRCDEAPPSRDDLQEWVTRAYLMGCTNSNDSRMAAHYAACAVTAADDSGLPYLQVLARVACAEFSPATRDTLYAAAESFAALTGSLQLQRDAHTVRSGGADLGLLQNFVERMRKPRVAVPALEVRFLTVDVLRNGASVTLRESERALLFALAHHPATTPTTDLLDRLWPDLDGDAAAVAFRVCLHRLRRGLGDPRSIVRTNGGCRLQPGAVADIWGIAETLKRARSIKMLDPETHARLSDLRISLQANSAARHSAPSWFASYESEINELTRDVTAILARAAGNASSARFASH